MRTSNFKHCTPPPPPAARTAMVTPQQTFGLPKPNIRDEPTSFSTKKERGTPRSRAPPRPPAKTCPPISRVFKRRPDFLGRSAQTVSFRQSSDGSLTGTPLQYDNSQATSYFEQTFEVEKTIGAGYFGTVVKARDKATGQLYAIKIANERYKGNSDRTRKLEEVRKHEVLLPHPNCVHFYQSWEENGRLHQQFELCETSLADLSEKKHEFPEHVIWAILVDLLLAVKHLHDHHLAHMDIKPENIFLGRDGLCKLGDFGLVIDLAQDATSLNFVPGDAKYMAKELLEHKFSKAADIFSLGVTVLELACDLDLPNGGHLWHQLRLSGPEPSLTAKLSPELRQLIQLMMCKDSKSRPTAKQLLEMPAVIRARKERSRQLAIQGFVRVIRWFCLPIFTLLIFLFTFLIVHPISFIGGKLMAFFQKPEVFLTPPQEGKTSDHGSQPRTPLWSDDDDLEHSRASSHSILASPLTQDSEWPSPIRSPYHYPLGPRQLDDNRQTQSTPSGLRFRARSRPLGEVPKNELHFHKGREEPDVENSMQNHLTSHGDEDDSDESTKIRPVSLAAKFDCFSDEDNSDKE